MLLLPVFGAAICRGWPFMLRFGLLVAALFGLAVVASTVVAVTPNWALTVDLIVGLTTMFLGVRAGLVAALVVIATHVVIAWGWTSGHLPIPLPGVAAAYVDYTVPVVWIRTLGLTGGLMVATVVLLRELFATLQRSRKFTQAILDSVPAHLAVLDQRGVIVAVNARWREFAQENPLATGGVPTHVDVGTNYLEICRQSSGETADGAMVAHDGIGDVIDGRRPSFTFEYRCDSPQKPRWFTMSATPMTDGERFVVVAHTEITERKQTEIALRDSGSLLRTVMDLVPHFIFVKDNQSRHLLVNTACAVANGLTPETMVGLRDSDFVRDPVQAEAFMRADREVIASGRPAFIAEERLTTAAGETRILQTTKIPFVAPGGGGPALMGMAVDITELKRAEAALRDSEDRMRSLVSLMPEAIFIGQEGRVVYINQRGLQLWRAERPEQILGRSPLELIAPECHAQVRERLRQLVIDGATLSIVETKIVTLDGEIIPVETTAAAFPYGGKQAVQVVVHDITERKRAADALRYHQAILEETGRIAKVGGWSFDAITGEASWTDEVARIHDLDPANSISREIGLEYYVGESRVRIEAAVKNAVEHAIPYDLELEIVSAKGVRKWVRTIAHPVAENGRVIRVYGSFQDITERKATECALRQKEQLLHAADRRLAEILQGMSEACFALDAQWRFTFVNDRGEVLLRHRRSEMLGNVFWEVFHQLVGTPMERNYRRAMAERVPVAFEVFSPVAERWLDIRLFPSGDGLAAFLLDIQQRKEGEAAIQRLNAELEQRVVARTAELEAANKELEAFSYSVSHDLRAPLRAVNGFSEMVLDQFGPQLPDEGRRYLETVRASACEMGELIDDLLTFSRLSRQALDKHPVDVRQLVTDCFRELQPGMAGRQIELKIGELPPCRGDRSLLKQVWMNLLGNAVKYTRRRPAAVIEVDCLQTAEGPVYRVRDNGTGFDMRYARKLFGVFQRLHRAEEFEGTGVGLAIVQRIVHRHGGRVWAEATPDCGATFYFTLESNPARENKSPN